MPYINGLRVSNEVWTERYGSFEKLRTGPNGENPGEAVELNEETGAPEPNPQKNGAGGRRSAKSAKATKAAIADALGVTEDSAELADIDVSDLDEAAIADALGVTEDSAELADIDVSDLDEAAIADALGVTEDSAELADIDVSDLDAPSENKEDE